MTELEFLAAFLAMETAQASMDSHDAECAVCRAGSESYGDRCDDGARRDGAFADAFASWSSAQREVWEQHRAVANA